MKAITQDRYGPDPEDVLRLQETERPAIRDDEVLVNVRAASVDRGTWHAMAGTPYPIRIAGFGVCRPKHPNPGRNLAGTVEAVGPRVTGVKAGDEVFGIGTASFGEYAAARPAKLAPKPSNLSFEQAATVPVSGLTALQAVRDHGRIRSGQHVLVIGASGGVGSFAAQIAKAFGATVTGMCGTTKIDMVQGLGADRVIDCTTDDLDDSGPYDVILDTGGNRSLPRLRAALAPRGTLVIVGGETGGRWLDGASRQLRAQFLSPMTSQKLCTFICSENAEDLRALRGLIESGKVTPAVDRAYPLAEVPAAIRYLVEGHARGKIGINVR